ncbi:MAG: EAL domain-containing protein [Proteocatella sp.]
MFIARQPIFNKDLDVYGYELLFRSDIKSNKFDGTSSEIATATVISGLFESGINRIVEDKYAFINFDEDFVLSSGLELISPDRLIVEMLENIKISDSLIKRLEDIKKKGYKIALDDFIGNYSDYPLTPFADIIKFDVLATPLDTIHQSIHLALSQKKIILAEKIETEQEFLKAKKMGFHLFQGYFFSKPSITGKSLNKSSSKIPYLLIIKELQKEEPSFQSLAEIIEKDINLAYRFMRIVSLRSGEDSIYSIKKALTYIGLKEIERWISLLMIQDISKSKPQELIKLSLIRTKFSELIALHCELKNMRDEAYLMGLFSTLDAMLDEDMSEALKDITLPYSITEVLIHHRGVLSPIYDLFIAYEQGNWVQSDIISKKMNINQSVLYEDYLSSIKWANATLLLMQ